jgi:hypothetical protein
MLRCFLELKNQSVPKSVLPKIALKYCNSLNFLLNSPFIVDTVIISCSEPRENNNSFGCLISHQSC